MKKVTNRAGFTLAETLMAVLILLMVSAIVAQGVPVAKNAYEKVVLAANAEVLLSTAVAALRDELGTAWDVRTEANGAQAATAISYYSADIRARSRISMGTDDAVNGTKGTILLQEYVRDKELEGLGIEAGQADTTGSRALVSSAAASASVMYVRYDSVSVDANNNIVFEGLQVRRVSDDSVLADLGKTNGASNALKIQANSAVATPTVAPGS